MTIKLKDSAIETSDAEAQLVLDKGDSLWIELGINIVEIKYYDKSWHICHNKNIVHVETK